MIDRIDKEDLAQATEILRKGGVILYPTETVWGLGCDATNPRAVERVFRIKEREDSKAMISLVSDMAMLERWVDDIPEAAYQLIDTAVSPITIIYDHPRGIAPSLCAADGSAAFRVTASAFAGSLCRALRKPIVSTSANISGRKAPGTFTEIDRELLATVDYVCKTGREKESQFPPSSVVKVSDGNLIKIIRP